MKTKLLYLIASFAFVTNCSAQWATTIDVNLKNGEQIKTIISDGEVWSSMTVMKTSNMLT